MHALLFEGQLTLASGYPEPQLRPGEALIRPSLVGICNTDIEITRGYRGFHGVLGHEFVGAVVACHSTAWLGRRVVGEINAACGACEWCARGERSHCPNRTTLGIRGRDGAMAELLSLPLSCLHEVPASLPDDVAVFTEPVAAAVEILEQSHLRPTDWVAVVGDGKLGILCAQALRLPGCAVTLIGRHPERWGWLSALGVEAVRSETVEQALAQRGRTDSARAASFDVVVDCTGSPGGLAIARELVRPRGRLILKSTFAAESRIDLSRLAVDEIQLVGSRCGPFDAALRLLARGLIVTTPLIADRFPLHDGLRAFQAADHRLKVLLEV